MKLRLRKANKDGFMRVESEAKVKEIIIKEDFLHPGEESIAICFKGKNSSGIIDITPDEFEMMDKSIKDRIHLIKGMKKYKG